MLVRHYDRRGVYLVNSGYKLAINQKLTISCSSNGKAKEWWDSLWKQQIPPKIKMFMWRVFNDCVPSVCNLMKKGIEVCSDCGSCKIKGETTDHVLLCCRRVKEIWGIILPRIFQYRHFHQSVQDRIVMLHESLSAKEFELICISFWAIQNGRNSNRAQRPINLTFEADVSGFTPIGRKLKKGEDMVSTLNLQPAKNRNGVSLWKAPPRGWMKFNVNAAATQDFVTRGLK